MIVFVTGMTGSGRREFVQDSTKQLPQGCSVEIIDAWDTVSNLPNVTEATILNLPDDERDEVLRRGYREVASAASAFKKTRGDQRRKAQVILSHAVFRWRGSRKLAFPRDLLQAIAPDVFITVVQNLRGISEAFAKDAFARHRQITLEQILDWREDEIEETSRMAAELERPHKIVLRADVVSNFGDLVFEPDKKSIYFSFPISHASPDQQEHARKLVDELRKNFTVFDPLCVDDIEFIEEIKGGGRSPVPVGDIDALETRAGLMTVTRDYRLIGQSNMVVANYDVFLDAQAGEDGSDPYVPLSAGVICEMKHGDERGKSVYAVWPLPNKPSPFFEYHAERVFKTSAELAWFLREYKQ